jgi:hypothetical protein
MTAIEILQVYSGRQQEHEKPVPRLTDNGIATIIQTGSKSD